MSLMNVIRLIPILICCMLSGCMSADGRIKTHTQNINSYSDFGICSGYGCKNYHPTGLTDEEWDNVERLFQPQAKNAIEERKIIAKAIALMEQYIGPKTGTENDKARAVVINFSTDGQMDCVDEAINSTTYIYLMRKYGLIKFHSLGAPARRNLNDLSYPHSSATIYEIDKEKIEEGEGHFVVDSWFHKNGALAEIIPTRTWKGRWYPEEKLDFYNFSAS